MYFTKREGNAIDEIRLIATVLLVICHVVGWQDSGLRLQYPHPLRILVDVVGDFRMPAFALIAGAVYALRPPLIDGFGPFFLGKLHRLAVPGLISALIFSAIAGVAGSRWAISPDSLWQVLIYPYAHYWFLQSILVLFVIVGLFDATTKHRAELPMFGIATLLSVASLPFPSIFSINNAVHLAPFFLAGTCYTRNRQWLETYRKPVIAMAGVLITLWLAWTILDYVGAGTIDISNRQVQALMLGLPACALMLFYLPGRPLAGRLAEFSFTIYLYHVLGTAGMRRILMMFGVDSLAVYVIAGVAAGLLVPIAIHLCARSSPLAQQLILGIKLKRPPVPSKSRVPTGLGTATRQEDVIPSASVPAE